METIHHEPFFELLVSNIAADSSDASIHDFFTRFGDVRWVKSIHRGSGGAFERSAFVRIAGEVLATDLAEDMVLQGQTLAVRILSSPDRSPRRSRRNLY